MRITYGNRRFVVLTSDFAIKIGKIRLIRFVSRLLILPFSKRLRIRFLMKYGPGWTTALFNDMFAGVLSNKNEYEFSTTHTNKKIVPTIKLYCWGIIAIQIRGTPVSEEELSRFFPDYASNAYRIANLDRPEQYCWHNNKIVVCDYGEFATHQLISDLYVFNQIDHT